jgi:hypothetical protein
MAAILAAPRPSTLRGAPRIAAARPVPRCPSESPSRALKGKSVHGAGMRGWRGPASRRDERMGSGDGAGAKVYRKCKVWADVDDSGRLIEQRGLVKIRYRKDDPEAYSAKVSEVSDLDPAEEAASKSAESRGEGAAPAPPKRPRAPRKPAAKSKASAADTLVIHTDGSCFGNPGPAGVGS